MSLQHSRARFLHLSVSLLPWMSTRPTKKCAHWTSEGESTLLLFLIDHKAVGDSGGFKKSTWNAAAININKNISKGGMKTGDTFKNKFWAVSPFFSSFELFYSWTNFWLNFRSSKRLMKLSRPSVPTWVGPGMTTRVLTLPQRRRAPGMTMWPSTQLCNSSAMQVGSIWMSLTVRHHLQPKEAMFFMLPKGLVQSHLMQNPWICMVPLTLTCAAGIVWGHGIFVSLLKCMRAVACVSQIITVHQFREILSMVTRILKILDDTAAKQTLNKIWYK